ncbi:MAG: Hsp20/alpha crystallin family protein [Paludibacterium sp.]|uniref:Hsp20/alpha crystallin family protein n=1 Tax=Paludibacterium sp. TaxID=1917523 RepID=UPI0025DB7419|nr:Hsp20/alpha crystallin family protein [Paludibacterium sp.]MBV8049082.1 Hsp20/alpha crystallin family protein [Paludibacterium sp.]MBV8649408.1 Hsp20/alpha crystallin family protein [Paludibacterium sp.]
MNEQNTTPMPSGDERDAALLPAVNVIEDAAGITLLADLPGVPKDKLRLQIETDTLIIEGDMQLNMPEDMAPTHVEVGSPRYRRVFTLSKELDAERVTAEFEQGVLTLRIPKAAHAQPRKIAVRVA